MGFEPTLAEPNGLAVHHLNHWPPRRREKLRFVSSRSLPREVEFGKQILSQNSTGKYGDIGHTSFLRLPRFRSVVYITCA